MQSRKSLSAILVISIALLSATLLLEYCRPSGSGPKETATSPGPASYVGNASCKSCHAKEHALWEQSDHFRAMMPANDTTVLGDFNNASLSADGISSRFYKKDGKFFIQTEGPDGKPGDFEVLYTFGYKPLQQYLVAFPGGRMQVPRVSWDVNKKKWFHQYAGQKIYHGDWLHWSRGGQNWNTMCASCHSTNLQKNYSPDADSFHTTWSVMTVSCESCHGPASEHLRYVESDSYKKGEKVKYAFLRQVDTPNLVQANSCAPCHARKADIAAQTLNTGEIMDDLIPEIPGTEHYFADGQVNDEDYIYTSFLQSKMFHRNVKCTNCHNAHSGKLVLPVQQVCLQCHAKTYDSFDHTKHDMASGQVTCVSCHMPGKYYMGNDLRHDHSFRVPRPDLSVKYGTPNACNVCHANKTTAWASEAVVKWYGPQRKYHFADDLVPGSRVDQQSEAHLARLISDSAVPAIVKATAADYLRNLPTQKSLALLLTCLHESDPQIRYRALRSLAGFPAATWRDAVGPLLEDKVRAVRIAAADLFLQIPPAEMPQAYAASLAKSKNELEQYNYYQADFAVGNVMLGDYYMRLGDDMNAVKYYRRGLAKDSLMNYARLNLSAVYNRQGNNAEALKVLLDAQRTDPKNDRIYYNLALLYAEMKDIPHAGENFGKAVALNSDDPRVYYNYGILQQQQGKVKEAEELFQKGLKMEPRNADLNYALAFLYMQLKQPGKAMGPALILKQINPGNPDYQKLFQALKLG